MSGWILAVLLCVTASTSFGQYNTITNDVFWKDSSGNPIYSQGGGVSKFGSTYYWYGVQYGGAATYYSTGTAGSDTSFVAITCYTSTDLAHWTKQNNVVTTSTTGFSGTSWVGRMGSVAYNSSTGKYVLWVGYAGPSGTGVACCTCSTPTGNFTLNNVQTAITNVYYNVPGDMTVFVDYDHSATPYLVYSDPHGREHLYVSTFNSSYTAINPAVLISEWPQGQEADCMFYYKGRYYACMSNLAGWSYSSAYQVNSTAIQTPSDYTADAAFAGTTADYTHHAQISFFIQVEGTAAETIVCAADRWADFDSSYKSAGFGNGYNEWCPLSFSGTTPTYWSNATWKLNVADGHWSN